MRHLNSGRKLNRTSAHRKALFKNMVLALIRHERIKTTDPKAKELRRIADRMVTLGKQNDLAARRRAFAALQSHEAVKKLFDEIAPRFKDRNGGYTRVIKFGHRRGDAAMLSVIEFTGNEEQTKSKKPRKRRSKEGRRDDRASPSSSSGGRLIQLEPHKDKKARRGSLRAFSFCCYSMLSSSFARSAMCALFSPERMPSSKFHSPLAIRSAKSFGLRMSSGVSPG